MSQLTILTDIHMFATLRNNFKSNDSKALFRHFECVYREFKMVVQKVKTSTSEGSKRESQLVAIDFVHAGVNQLFFVKSWKIVNDPKE